MPRSGSRQPRLTGTSDRPARRGDRRGAARAAPSRMRRGHERERRLRFAMPGHSDPARRCTSASRKGSATRWPRAPPSAGSGRCARTSEAWPRGKPPSRAPPGAAGTSGRGVPSRWSPGRCRGAAGPRCIGPPLKIAHQGVEGRGRGIAVEFVGDLLAIERPRPRRQAGPSKAVRATALRAERRQGAVAVARSSLTEAPIVVLKKPRSQPCQKPPGSSATTAPVPPRRASSSTIRAPIELPTMSIAPSPSRAISRSTLPTSPSNVPLSGSAGLLPCPGRSKRMTSRDAASGGRASGSTTASGRRGRGRAARACRRRGG